MRFKIYKTYYHNGLIFPEEVLVMSWTDGFYVIRSTHPPKLNWKQLLVEARRLKLHFKNYTGKL